MTMKRAYAQLEIRAALAADGKRTFTGIASTISTDRMDDIVEPKGALFKLPLPLLWHHNSREPIGWVTGATVGANSIQIVGEVASIDEPGTLKDRLDEAWQSLQIKLVRGLSIGFDPIETAQIEGTWGYRYTKWDWLELSCVTIPANADCSIASIKSFDAKQRAAFGPLPGGAVRLVKPPGASGPLDTFAKTGVVKLNRGK